MNVNSWARIGKAIQVMIHPSLSPCVYAEPWERGCFISPCVTLLSLSPSLSSPPPLCLPLCRSGGFLGAPWWRRRSQGRQGGEGKAVQGGGSGQDAPDGQKGRGLTSRLSGSISLSAGNCFQDSGQRDKGRSQRTCIQA